MGSPLIPLVLTGATILILSNRKHRPKTSKSGGSATLYKPLEPALIPKAYDTPSNDSVSDWRDRQEALQLLSGVEFLTEGDPVPLCSKCYPGDADGVPGPKTKGAIKAFQAIAGLDVDGEWGPEEDGAMRRILTSLSKGDPIHCDPLVGYPAPLACFAAGDGFHLGPGSDDSDGPILEPAEIFDSEDYGPDDILVTDPECNTVLHQDVQWFTEQKYRSILYAMEGMTDGIAAAEINESMWADYAPLCLSLGRDGLGPGVRDLWDKNVAWTLSLLEKYETLPELLEDDAKTFGLL